MKKIVAFLAIAVIIGGIAYTSIDWNSSKDNASEAKQQVALAGGGTIELAGEEAALNEGPGEKKVVITDLGMF